MLQTNFTELDCAKRIFFKVVLKLRRLRQSNIVAPSTTKSEMSSCFPKDTGKYILEDYQGFISQVYISHMDYGLLTWRICTLKRVAYIMCNVN